MLSVLELVKDEEGICKMRKPCASNDSWPDMQQPLLDSLLQKEPGCTHMMHRVDCMRLFKMESWFSSFAKKVQRELESTIQSAL